MQHQVDKEESLLRQGVLTRHVQSLRGFQESTTCKVESGVRRASEKGVNLTFDDIPDIKTKGRSAKSFETEGGNGRLRGGGLAEASPTAVGGKRATWRTWSKHAHGIKVPRIRAQSIHERQTSTIAHNKQASKPPGYGARSLSLPLHLVETECKEGGRFALDSCQSASINTTNTGAIDATSPYAQTPARLQEWGEEGNEDGNEIEARKSRNNYSAASNNLAMPAEEGAQMTKRALQMGQQLSEPKEVKEEIARVRSSRNVEEVDLEDAREEGDKMRSSSEEEESMENSLCLNESRWTRHARNAAKNVHVQAEMEGQTPEVQPIRKKEKNTNSEFFECEKNCGYRSFLSDVQRHERNCSKNLDHDSDAWYGNEAEVYPEVGTEKEISPNAIREQDSDVGAVVRAYEAVHVRNALPGVESPVLLSGKPNCLKFSKRGSHSSTGDRLRKRAESLPAQISKTEYEPDEMDRSIWLMKLGEYVFLRAYIFHRDICRIIHVALLLYEHENVVS